jgi:hypothetical protein
MTRVIPKEQMYVLLGIRQMIKHYMEIVDELEIMALQISGEVGKDGKPEVGGYTSSAMLGHLDLDEMFKQLDIQVEKKQYKKYVVLPEKPEEKKEEENVSTEV